MIVFASWYSCPVFIKTILKAYRTAIEEARTIQWKPIVASPLVAVAQTMVFWPQPMATLSGEHRTMQNLVKHYGDRRNELYKSPVELTRGSRSYKPGDKVMQIKNDYDKEVFNGDIGRTLNNRHG